MVTRDILEKMVIEALKKNSGKASVLEVSKFIWENYHKKLMKSGDMLYTWQYEVRWVAVNLRKKGLLKPAASNKRGEWRLN